MTRVALSLAPDAHAGLEQELRAAFERVLASGSFVLGEEVRAFERELSALCGAAHAVGVSSGSDALVTALQALDVGPGAEVVTTPFTFVATAEAILRLGARPVFADVEPKSLTLDPANVATSPRARAILVVHLFGHAAELAALARFELPVVEDVAQALGGRDGGRALGTLGALGCASFFPTKPLGALGDGGAVLTANTTLAERVRRLRQHGSSDKQTFTEPGGNYRLDALQAAFLRVKLARLEGWLEARRRIAESYSRELAGVAGLELPQARAGTSPAWSHYVVRVKDGRRDALARHLGELGIDTGVYYARPLHLQPMFAFLGHREGDFPVAERAAKEVLAIPMRADLNGEERTRVVDGLRSFFE